MRTGILIALIVALASSLAWAEQPNSPSRLRIRVVLPDSISEEEAGLTAWLDGRLLGDLPG